MTLENITLHACERFAERAMGMPEGIKLLREKSQPIALRIYNMLLEKYPLHDGLPSGHFPIKEQGIIIVKEDGNVVTIKEFAPLAAYSGGMRSQLKNKRKDKPRTKSYPHKPKEL